MPSVIEKSLVLKLALFVGILTGVLSHLAIAAKPETKQDYVKLLALPPCPAGSERVILPSEEQPNWFACRDPKGLYQGLLIQTSNQLELIRVAVVTNSLRDGKEIRKGEPGTLEERHYRNGQLDGPSYIFRTPAALYQLMPKPLSIETWNLWQPQNQQSILAVWTKQEPTSTIGFSNGRLARLQAMRVSEDPKTGKTLSQKTDYQFRAAPDGRVFSNNHPEMKGLFFIDPEALWALNAADLKAALSQGFGSCKKYAGPIGRLGRHYDRLLYRRESSEQKHIDRLKEIRDRFVSFCVPEDIRTNLGVLECPPQLPSPRVPTLCYLPLSTQAKLPYLPKFFKFEFTLKQEPNRFVETLRKRGMVDFLSKYEPVLETLDLVGDGKKESKVSIKKTPRGVRWRPFELQSKPGDQDKTWWEWMPIPGH